MQPELQQSNDADTSCKKCNAGIANLPVAKKMQLGQGIAKKKRSNHQIAKKNRCDRQSAKKNDVTSKV
jgi:hypothetical protein